MTEFAKEGAISFGDKTIPAYDYFDQYCRPIGSLREAGGTRLGTRTRVLDQNGTRDLS